MMLRRVMNLERPAELIQHGLKIARDAFDDPVLKSFKTSIDCEGDVVYEMEFISREQLETLGWSEVVLITYDTIYQAYEAMCYERNRHFGTKIRFTEADHEDR